MESVVERKVECCRYISEIPGNPEIPDNHLWKSGNPGQTCTKSRNPDQFLGFPKSWKSRKLFWEMKCPSTRPVHIESPFDAPDSPRQFNCFCPRTGQHFVKVPLMVPF